MPKSAQSLPRSSRTPSVAATALQTPAAALRRRRKGLAGGPEAQGEERPLLLCFSHLRWNFVFQRPQHLLNRAARHYRVAIFEEPVFDDGATPVLEASEVAPGITVLVPHLPHGIGERAATVAQRALLDEYLAVAGAPQVLWYYAPLAMAFSSHLHAPVHVFDCMDELSGFKGASAALPLMERRLIARADLVFTGGMSLYEAKRNRHPRVYGFPSSVDSRHFAQARDPDRRDPDDQAGIPGPRLGFFGVVDERMDIDLLAAAAALRPDWHFVMVGPVVKIDPASLPRRPNVHWLGGRRYDELPAYLGGWDVGIMPFALNEATRYISPTKTPEFLAAGLPVVSTPIVDVVSPYGEKGLVEIASDAEAFVSRADALIGGRPPAWQERVDRHLASMSWDRTWQEMHRLMTGVLAVKAPAARNVVRPLVEAGAAHV